MFLLWIPRLPTISAIPMRSSERRYIGPPAITVAARKTAISTPSAKKRSPRARRCTKRRKFKLEWSAKCCHCFSSDQHCCDGFVNQVHFISPSWSNNAAFAGFNTAQEVMSGNTFGITICCTGSADINSRHSLRREVTITPMISARTNAATMTAPAYRTVLRLKIDFNSTAAVDRDEDDS